jgi:hypothetical protein
VDNEETRFASDYGLAKPEKTSLTKNISKKNSAFLVVNSCHFIFDGYCSNHVLSKFKSMPYLCPVLCHGSLLRKSVCFVRKRFQCHKTTWRTTPLILLLRIRQ